MTVFGNVDTYFLGTLPTFRVFKMAAAGGKVWLTYTHTHRA